jgi:hypothetical protein
MVLVAVIGFSFIACDDGGGDDGGSPGKLTITGLGTYNDKYVYALGYDTPRTKMLFAAKSINVSKNETVCEKIGGGSVALNVWEIDTSSNKSKDYNGSDSITFSVYIWDKEKIGAENEPIAMGGVFTVTFANGTANGTASGTFVGDDDEEDED